MVIPRRQHKFNRGPYSISLEVLLGQTMISTLDKRLGAADDDVQPVEQTGIGIVGFVLMGITFEKKARKDGSRVLK